jgi:hypothetical protein
MFDPAQPTRIIANGDNRHIFFEVHDRIYGVLGTAIGGEPWQDFAPRLDTRQDSCTTVLSVFAIYFFLLIPKFTELELGSGYMWG